MPINRSRKVQAAYDDYSRTADPAVCAFCAAKKGDDQLVEEYTYFKVLKNNFGYSMWDGQDVADHLMVVPKEHTDSLAGMTADQKVEYVDIITAYESRGYDIYARAPHSPMKSVVHQHTHLIKPAAGKPKRFLLYVDKPYIRWMF